MDLQYSMDANGDAHGSRDHRHHHHHLTLAKVALCGASRVTSELPTTMNGANDVASIMRSAKADAANEKPLGAYGRSLNGAILCRFLETASGVIAGTDATRA